MKKIVVLNSGGFDSTTLLADISTWFDECEIHSLYFDYGQPNSLYDSKCAKDNADKVKAIHHEIILPRISWTKNNFYSESTNEHDTQYLEMRNVIFISYALSLAESIGADSIYMAILANGTYPDTKPEFIEKMKSLCSTFGISFETPYSEVPKNGLFYIAKKLGVGTKFKYFSCDTPIMGKPCGKCPDCEALKDYEYIINNKNTAQHFVESGYTISPEFEKSFKDESIYEMRVILNNSCQLHCEHCYHGDNELLGDILTDEELINAIVEARNLGIESIHFAGKEPLFDDRIFRIIEGVKSRNVNDIDFSVVTNGINVPKYVEELKKSGISKVFLSADDEIVPTVGIRHNAINAAVKRAIQSLCGSGIEIEIFYDLTPQNIEHTIANLRFWYVRYHIRSFYIRTIRFVGNAVNNIKPLTLKQLCNLHSDLKEVQGDCNIVLNIGVAPYAFDILSDNSEITEEIREDVDIMTTLGTVRVNDIYSLYFELFCNRYYNQITLTADGYLIGCAMESSVKEYDKVSVGNIRNKSLEELINLGKEQSLQVNKTQCTKDCIYFEKCLFTPIDF